MPRPPRMQARSPSSRAGVLPVDRSENFVERPLKGLQIGFFVMTGTHAGLFVKRREHVGTPSHRHARPHLEPMMIHVLSYAPTCCSLLYSSDLIAGS